MRLNQKEVIETNKILCEEFGQTGTVINEGNLDFAIDQFDQEEITIIELCRKMIQGHCFLDGNKRTAFVVYMWLNKVTNSKNPLVTLPIIGVGLIEYTKRLLNNDVWHGWLKLLSEV